jgi:purine nucleosidase
VAVPAPAGQRAWKAAGMRLNVDTDFAGDTDDACAVAMVLGWPGAEVTGMTTTADPDGRRAGYLRRFLRLAGRDDIPVVAGAGVSSTTGRPMGGIPDHARYWGGEPVVAEPAPAGAATGLLLASIEAGATLVAIGPYTNLAVLEDTHPGRLAGVPVVATGGWVYPPASGLPAWGPDADWNVQCDTRAALVVAATADLTLCALPAAMRATLRAAHLPRLAASGPLGALLGRQSAAYAEDEGLTELGRRHPGLPDDLVNVQWDAVTCAVALGWPGARTREVPLRPVLADDVLRFQPDGASRATRLLVEVDEEAFAETWITAVEAAQHRR